MSGKCRPSLRSKTLSNVMDSNLSKTDKECIFEVFKRFEELGEVIKELGTELEQVKEEIELYKNTHYKLQYKGEELTVSEVGKKLDELEHVKAERDTFLKEKAEREKGCEFCNAEYAVMSGSRMSSELIHKGCVAKFCPNCGKRLVSEE